MKDVKESVVAQGSLLYQHLPEEAEKSHKNLSRN